MIAVRSMSSSQTQPSEIPTALIEEVPFDDDEQTENKTIDLTCDEDETPSLRKFRRPTKSEIVDAVESVNTESLDVAELHRARLAQDETEDVD